MTLTPAEPVLQLHDSARREKVAFEPFDPENVTMYVCGPTVYDRAHLGNARSAVVFDVLSRLLRHLYPRVTYVRNVTDVDDKINARARETGRPIREITDETLGWYHEDMAALGVLPPDHEPRATEYVPQMVAMIEVLVERGHAYEAEGHVLFSVRSDARYGELSGRSLDDMIAGARVEVAPYKRDPMDFVLWKPSGDDEPGWDSPWGRGRPGWHIECSAMSAELLGETFDIHGGGTDLLFPHHENELAQSTCAHPMGGFARHWVHNAMLRVDGQKMSKSLGNFFTVRDMLDRGVPGPVIRLVLLSARHSQTLDWSEERINEAQGTLRDWCAAVKGKEIDGGDPFVVVDALTDDLNTALAISELKRDAEFSRPADLVAGAALLGFNLPALAQEKWAQEEAIWHKGIKLVEGDDYQPTVGVIGWGGIASRYRDEGFALGHRWAYERRKKNWAEADHLRSLAMKNGIELRSTHSVNGVQSVIVDLSGNADFSFWNDYK